MRSGRPPEQLEKLLGPARTAGSPLLLGPDAEGADPAVIAESQRFADIAASTQKLLADICEKLERPYEAKALRARAGKNP